MSLVICGRDSIERTVCKSLTGETKKAKSKQNGGKMVPEESWSLVGHIFIFAWMTGCIISRDGLCGAEIKTASVLPALSGVWVFWQEGLGPC